MLKKHSQLFEGLFTVSDLLVVSVAWFASYWIRFSTTLIPVSKGVPPFSDYTKMLLFVWLIWGFIFRRNGLYRPMRGASRWREIWLLLRANSISIVLLLSATYLFWEKSVPFSRGVFVIFWITASLLTITSRSIIRMGLRAMRRKGFNLRYALVVGNGRSAEAIVRSLSEHPEFGIELIGCLVNPKKDSIQKKEDTSSLPIVGVYEDLPKFLNHGKIDQVIIALPYDEHECLEDVISSIGDQMLDVRIVPDLQQFIQLGSQIEEFDGVPVVSLASTPLSGFNLILKRIFDLLLGTLLFLCFFIPMLVIAILVKLTSPGQIFFSQERVGLDGRTFYIYKFRTMRIDAEVDGAKFAVEGDTRTTLIGGFLRQFSLDELPQLWNVIMGQMSLVGPRPERPVFIREFRQRIPRYMLRHKVQAGMTGWAQVNGWRGNTSIEKRIECDLYYIEHWSLLLDLKILGLTLINGIRNRNAY
jgi:Undecaprenyl-phosphate glucose phosphotransferase